MLIRKLKRLKITELLAVNAVRGVVLDETAETRRKKKAGLKSESARWRMTKEESTLFGDEK